MQATTDPHARPLEAGQAFFDRRGQRWLVDRVDRSAQADDAHVRLTLHFAPPDTREAAYLMSVREFRALARARGFRPEARVPA